MFVISFVPIRMFPVGAMAYKHNITNVKEERLIFMKGHKYEFCDFINSQ